MVYNNDISGLRIASYCSLLSLVSKGHRHIYIIVYEPEINAKYRVYSTIAPTRNQLLHASRIRILAISSTGRRSFGGGLTISERVTTYDLFRATSDGSIRFWLLKDFLAGSFSMVNVTAWGDFFAGRDR